MDWIMVLLGFAFIRPSLPKIKAKMALDDAVNARAIDVSTHGTTVTLQGSVRSTAEHDRALALARETAGVTQVIDQLGVRRAD